MKAIYLKELKIYLTNILTYIFISIILIIFVINFTNSTFDILSYNSLFINYELPIYKLFIWFITLIPILIFLNYSVQKNKRIDTNLYVSNISSFKIIIAKILAITTIFLIPLLIILILNIILKLIVYKSSDMTISIYILSVFIILISAAFSIMIYTFIKNPILALIVSTIFQNVIMIFITFISKFELALFLPYLQGIVPLATTLIYIFLIILFTSISILKLNSKRNIK